MTDAGVTLRPAAGDLSYVENLLAENDLPARDVRSKPDCFYIGSVDGDSVGVGGLEPFESTGLLRSLVVERSARGNGFGAGIRAALEREARTAGIEALYLLTTTAAGFFAAHGYAEIDRSEAPLPVRQTTEFADLCPATAVCMRKRL